MDVSAKMIRDVEFREEKRGGYHVEDVDEFLEQVALGVETLQDRLRQAVERAQRAEAAAAESGGNDETLKRTLVLAQRTADMAVQEAREQAARILAAAEQQAQVVRSEAEQQARRLHEDTLGGVRADLTKLEATRVQAQQEVDTLHRWAEEHRAHLRGVLKEGLEVIERGGVLSPPPTSRPLDIPRPPGGSAAPAAAPPVSLPPAPAPTPAAAAPAQKAAPNPTGFGAPPEESGGQETVAWSVTGEAPTGEHEVARVTPPGRPTIAAETVDSERPSLESKGDDPAVEEFFEDPEFTEDRRFGGRLRRRR